MLCNFITRSEKLSDGSLVWNVYLDFEDTITLVARPCSEGEAREMADSLNAVLSRSAR